MGQLALAMAADPHMVLAMASVIPGLGELAVAADMALYLYEGDYQNAALAGAMLLPGGAMLVLGAGVRGAREVMSLARAGAKDFRAVMDGSRIVRGLREAGTAVKDVLSIVGSKVKGWASDLIKGEGVLGNERGEIRLGRAADAGSASRRLEELVPAYGGGKVRGVLDAGGDDLRPLISGQKGPAAAIPRGTRGFNGITKTLVEGHAAAVMRQEGLTDATLYLNKVPCPDPTGCYNMLPRMIPPGARLRVVAPSGFDRVFTGLP